MLISLENTINSLNTLLWDNFLPIFLSFTGVFFTLKLGFVQLKYFKKSLSVFFSGIFSQKSSDGSLSSFSSLMTAVAAQVGTGNIAGAGAAIVSGGAGAIFWIWVSSFFSMAVIFAEATLAVKFRAKIHNAIAGGPVYYITKAFNGTFGKILSYVFAICAIISMGFVGSLLQSNCISESFSMTFNINPLSTGIFLSVLSFLAFSGGISRISSITEKIVPIMAIFYILGSIFVIFGNRSNIIYAINCIFVGAFTPEAITGGIVGISVRESIRYGVARGLLSNEAGIGSSPHAHALAKVKHPCLQGVVAILGVFIDTFIVLTLTAFVILTSFDNFSDVYLLNITGAKLALYSFNLALGSYGEIFIAICMFFFGFSSILGWYFFGEVNFKYLFGKKALIIYSLLVILSIICGSIIDVNLAWNVSDLFIGIMAIPNILSLLVLSPQVLKLSKNFDERNL